MSMEKPLNTERCPLYSCPRDAVLDPCAVPRPLPLASPLAEPGLTRSRHRRAGTFRDAATRPLPLPQGVGPGANCPPLPGVQGEEPGEASGASTSPPSRSVSSSCGDQPTGPQRPSPVTHICEEGCGGQWGRPSSSQAHPAWRPPRGLQHPPSSGCSLGLELGLRTCSHKLAAGSAISRPSWSRSDMTPTSAWIPARLPVTSREPVSSDTTPSGGAYLTGPCAH